MEHRAWHKGGLTADTASASFELSYFIQHKDQEFAKAIPEFISAAADVTLSGSERCESGRIGQSRKLLSWQRDRGFDPHPLRQTKLARADGLTITAVG